MNREGDNLYKIQSILMSIAELTFSDVLIFSVALTISYLSILRGLCNIEK